MLVQRRRRARRLVIDALEARCLMAGDLQVDLWPELDQFGGQVEMVMGYKQAGETDEQARIAYSLYDTGASVISFAASDQMLFDLSGNPIGIKVPGGATADAIGGSLSGDVSMPGEIIADGMHAMTFSGDFLETGIDFSQGAARPTGVQAFVGTETGSEALPTITGTVIHAPSPTHPNGTAAWIDMTAYKYDLGELFPEFPEFAGMVLDAPDLRFVDPGTKLTAPTDGTVSDVVRIPLELWGESNYANPGDSITYAENPVQTGAAVSFNGVTTSNHTMLFDSGAQLTVISTDMAQELGLNLDAPTTSITVQGAAGQVTVPGFTIDTLSVPLDNDADGTIDGHLTFNNVPIYVLDVVPGLDGIMGMNLFNLAHGMLYDPHDPAGASLQVSFFTNLERSLPDEIDLEGIDMLSQALPVSGSFVGQAIPGFGLNVPAPNQPPTNIDLSRAQVFANTSGAWVGHVKTTDADVNDTHTYTVSDARFEVRNGDLYLKPGSTVSLAETSIPLQITSTDSGSPALTVARSFNLDVQAAPANWDHAFQWMPKPADVDLSGGVTPLDAVLIINELNATGVRNLPKLAGGTGSGPFYDVSGDDVLNPLDALLVINYLNAGGGAEGEAAVAAAATPANVAETTAATDAAISSLFVDEEVLPREDITGLGDAKPALRAGDVRTTERADDIKTAALPPLRYWQPVATDPPYLRSTPRKERAASSLLIDEYGESLLSSSD
jgi:hypothetical protein